MELLRTVLRRLRTLLGRLRRQLAPPDQPSGKVLRLLLFPFLKLRRNHRISRELALIRASGLFDEKWYLEHCPDVARAGIDPVRHYLLFGGFEGRDPGPHFSSGWYLDTYRDVQATGINPLVHFLEKGIPEGRVTGPDQVIQDNSSQISATEQTLRTLLECQEADAAARLGEFLASGAELALPTSPEPLVSILLLFYNRAEMSLQCLQSLADGAGDVPFEVIIVDNASSDDTPQLLERLRNVQVLRNTANQGFGGGNNQAARHAQGKYLLFLNNDTQLLPGSLRLLVDMLESDPSIGAAGGKLIFPDGRLQEAGSLLWQDGSALGYGRLDDPFKPDYCFVREVDFCSAALLLTPRQLFLSLGGFDARYAPAYYEDADYCLTLWTHGRRVVFQPFAAAIHHEFGSSGSERALALQAEHRRTFVDKWRQELARFEPPDPARIVFARQHDRSRQRHILFIDDRIPDYRIGHGYPRTYRMLEMLAGMGYRITFFPMQLPTPIPDIAQALQMLGIEVLYRQTEQEDPRLKLNLEELLISRPDYYDVIFLSRPHNMQEALQPLKAHARAISIVYDAEALFSLRDIKFRELSGRPLPEHEQEKLIKAEVALVKPASIVTTVSPLEREYFLRHSSASVHILSHILQPHPTPAPFEERKDILFVGSIMTEPSPNEDAVRYFVNEILPLVRQEVECDFHIVGTNRIPAIWSLASEHVHVTGRVDDLLPFYNRCRLFVVPTRYSAGIPLKLLEAAAHGLPAVVTPLTASQLGWRPNQDLLVGHTPQEFARRVVDLYTGPELFQSLRRNALDRIAHDYSPTQFETTLRHILEKCTDKSSAGPSSRQP